MAELEPREEQTFCKSQHPVSEPPLQELQIKYVSEIYDRIWYKKQQLMTIILIGRLCICGSYIRLGVPLREPTQTRSASQRTSYF